MNGMLTIACVDSMEYRLSVNSTILALKIIEMLNVLKIPYQRVRG